MAKVLFEFGAFTVFVSCAENCVHSKSDMLVLDIGMVLVHQTSFVRFERNETLMPDNVPLLRAVSDRMKNEALYTPGLTSIPHQPKWCQKKSRFRVRKHTLIQDSNFTRGIPRNVFRPCQQSSCLS